MLPLDYVADAPLPFVDANTDLVLLLDPLTTIKLQIYLN